MHAFPGEKNSVESVTGDPSLSRRRWRPSVARWAAELQLGIDRTNGGLHRDHASRVEADVPFTLLDLPRFCGQEEKPQYWWRRKDMRRRRRFSQEFKFDAVSMVVDQGRDLYEVARELEIRPDMLRKWKRKFESDGRHAFPGSGQLKPDEKELRRLRRENERLRMERDILKKAVAICSDDRR